MGEVERDRYELDTAPAREQMELMLRALNRVEDQLVEMNSASKGAEVGTKSLGAAVFLGNLAFEAAKKAASLFYEAVKDGISGVVENERAVRQLRVVAGEYTEALAEQAEALEHLRGVSSEEVMSSQAILLRFGVQRSQLKATTEAILDYATATGTDLVAATRMVTRSVESGGDKLEALGVTFKTTGLAAHDMGEAVGALSKKFGGAAAADSESLAGRAKLTGIAMDDLKKSFGGLLVEFAQKTKILENLAEAFKGLQTAIFGPDNAEALERAELVIQWQESLAHQLRQRQVLTVQLARANREGDSAAIESTHKQLAIHDAAIVKLKELIRLNNERISGSAVGADKPPEDDRVTKAGAEAREKAEKEAFERHNKLVNAFLENEKVVEKKRTDAFKVELEIREKDFQDHEKRKTQVTDNAITERQRRERRSASGMQTAVASEVEKATMKGAEEGFMISGGATLGARLTAGLALAIHKIDRGKISAAYAESVVGPLLSTLSNAAMQIADVVAFQPFREFLTTNQAYKEEFLSASIERRQAELAEQGIIKTTAQLRKEAEQEAANEQKKRLAETLATIALEAGKQALFQVAEGIGNLAAYNYAAAGLNFAAAAAYGLVAGASGAAAFAITQSRGQTSSEREALESQKRKTDAANKRDAASSSSQRAKGDTQVIVYQLGITGQTRTAQARELKRIGAEYDGLVRLGGGMGP